MPGRTRVSNRVFRDDTTKPLQTQSGQVVPNPILGGLHHDNSRNASLNWDPRSRHDHKQAVLIALDGMVQVLR